MPKCGDRSQPLAGRTAWVTGAGRGLGRAMALALAEAGSYVAVTARRVADLDAVVEQIAVAGGHARAFAGSVSDSAFVGHTVAELDKDRSGIDALVNCAGISPLFRRSEQVTDAEWASVIDVNLNGTFYCSRDVGAAMIRRGRGSIVNISSVHAHVGYMRLAAYAASKGAIEALTRTMAVEWAPSGVRVNAIAPGYFRTDLSSGLLNSQHGEDIASRIPLGRLGHARELAEAVVFLASDASSYITGSTMFVDGGWAAQ